MDFAIVHARPTAGLDRIKNVLLVWTGVRYVGEDEVIVDHELPEEAER